RRCGANWPTGGARSGCEWLSSNRRAARGPGEAPGPSRRFALPMPALKRGRSVSWHGTYPDYLGVSDRRAHEARLTPGARSARVGAHPAVAAPAHGYRARPLSAPAASLLGRLDDAAVVLDPAQRQGLRQFADLSRGEPGL